MPPCEITIGEVNSPELLPKIPSILHESSALALEWPRLRDHIAGRTWSAPGRAWILALEPCADLPWIDQQHQRTAEIRSFLTSGGTFDFRGLFDPTLLLDKARIEGSALEGLEVRDLLTVAERVAAWRTLIDPPTNTPRYDWPAIDALSAPLRAFDLNPLLHQLRGKIEPDGSLNDDASPELRRIRRDMERQHRAIEESLRASSAALSEGAARRKTSSPFAANASSSPSKPSSSAASPASSTGQSSSGQTVFVEPLETIEQNNELVRLLDEEQSEIHRILVAMTRALGDIRHRPPHGHRDPRRSRIPLPPAPASPRDYDCTRPTHLPDRALPSTAARHPLLELRMRAQTEARPKLPSPSPSPSPTEARQLIISGPNTGGKTVSLKTIGLLAMMAQAGIPVPAERPASPLHQRSTPTSATPNPSSATSPRFSAHIVNLDRISREATAHSLVLLDELGSATDPEEGAALAVAIAQHFLDIQRLVLHHHPPHLAQGLRRQHAGVLNAAVGFDQQP